MKSLHMSQILFQKLEDCCGDQTCYLSDTESVGYLTCLHALVVFFRRGRPVVGFVDGRPEALVAAAPPDYTRARPVEGEVPVQGHLGDGRLEALERAGLL